jgi:phage gp29-like protein
MGAKLNTSKLTKAIALPQRLGEIIEPPAFFYERPYSDDYYSAIEAMLLDPHIRSQLELRKHAILSADIGFEGDEKAVEVVKRALEGINLHSDLKDLLSALEYGWAVVEVIWKKEDLWKVASIERRDPLRFRFNKEGKLVYADSGKEVEPYKFIWITYNGSAENPYGESALKPVYYVWKLKLLALNHWEVLTEKYAIPPVAVITDENAQDDTLNLIADALAELQSSSSAVFRGIKDLKTIDVGDKSEVFQSLIDYCNREISKAIVGQTLTSEAGDHGSYALAKVHKDVFLYIVKSDAKWLEHKLNITLIRWILELNSVSGDAKIRFTFKEDLELDKVIALIDRGFPVSKTALYERYGVPKPTSEEDAFVKPDLQGMVFGDKPKEEITFNFSNPVEDIFRGL